jgi:signal transduction histidine kinase
VDLALVVDQAVESARVDAAGAEVSLVVDRPRTLDAVADGIRMRQVVDNLIANAITFTPTGGRVRVALAGSDDQVELVVADSGEGIEEADLGDIFTSFVRGQNARRRLSPGTGLGLAIVRTIVEAHGGQVSVQSTPGVGTTVRVVVPR